MQRFFTKGLVLGIIVNLTIMVNANAYIDAGTGSAVIQLFFAALAGTVLVWRKLIFSSSLLFRKIRGLLGRISR